MSDRSDNKMEENENIHFPLLTFMREYLKKENMDYYFDQRLIDFQFLATTYKSECLRATGKNVDEMSKEEMESDKDLNDFMKYIVTQIEYIVGTCNREWSVHSFYIWILSRFNAPEHYFHF